MSITTLNFLSFLNPYLFQQAHQHVCWQRSLMRLIEYDATVPVIEEKDKFIRGTFWRKDKSDDIVKLAEWCSAVTIKFIWKQRLEMIKLAGNVEVLNLSFHYV